MVSVFGGDVKYTRMAFVDAKYLSKASIEVDEMSPNILLVYCEFSNLIS